MSKLIKVVAGVALVAVGVATGNFQLVFMGLSLAGGALLAPKNPARDRAASAATLQVGEVPRQAILGRAAVAGSLVDAFNYGGKNGTDWEVLVIALADHRCDALEGMFVNDTFVAFAADGAVAGFSGQLEVYWRPGTATQTVPAVLTANGPGWTANDRGKGVAWVTVAYKADAADAKNPVWPGGRPRFRWVVRGLRCYDPRKDTTAGGAGAHRWVDPATWEWSENPIVARYNWVRGIFATDLVAQPEMLLVGRGLSEIEAPAANLFARANLCDEVVGAEARYRIGGLVAASEAYIDVENDIAAACAGTIVQPEGSVEIDPGEARAPVASFTDDDLIVGSKVSWSDFLGTGDADWINTAVATFTDPGQGWKERSAPPRRDLADIAADGSPREAQIRLVLVSWMAQAQRVAEIARRFGRLWGRGQVTLPPRFAGIEEGDWVTWQSDRHFGGATLTFRVEAWGSDQAWHHQLTLRQISASVYSDTAPLDDGSVAAQQDAPGDVPAPAPGAWTLAVGTTGVGGAETPVLVVTGATDDPDARLVRMEYFLGALPPGVGEVWTDAGAVGPEVVRREIPVVVAGSYYVAVSYVIGGTTGDRLVLGPVSTTAQLAGKATTFFTPPPATAPTLALDFLRSKILDPRLTFTRASTATYFGADGRLKTAAANEPRFTHNPATGEPLGLLQEPAATNLLVRSEELDDAAWAKDRCSITPNAIAGPNGLVTMDKIVEDTTAANSHLVIQFLNKAASALPYTVQRVLKAGERTKASLRMIDGAVVGAQSGVIDLIAGTIGDPFAFGGGTPVKNTIEPLGNGMFLVTLTAISTAATTWRVDLVLHDAAGNEIYNGDGVSGLYATNAQLEATAYATSYTPTTTAPVTRAADGDLLSAPGFDDIYDPAKGTMFIDIDVAFQAGGAGTPVVLGISDGDTAANRANIYIFEADSSVRAEFNRSAAVQAALVGPAGTPGRFNGRAALSYAENDFALTVDGAVVSTDVNGTVTPSLPAVQMEIGSRGDIAGFAATVRPMLIRDVRFYPARLTNAELQAITAQPVAEAVGDVWKDGSAGNRETIWNGIKWALSRDGSITDALSGAVNKLEPIEDNADVTKAVTGIAQIVVEYDHTGTLKTGQIPKAKTYKLVITSTGAEVASGVTWAVTTISGSWTGTAPSIAGAGTGTLTLNSDPAVSEVLIKISATLAGKTYPFSAQVKQQLDDPPVSGGGSGTFASQAVSAQPSTSWIDATGELTAKTGVGITNFDLTLAGASITSADGTPPLNGSSNVQCQWLWWDGGAWQIVGAVADSSPDVAFTVGEESEGSITCNRQKTGLTGDTQYKFKAQVKISSGTIDPVNVFGTASIEGGT